MASSIHQHKQSLDVGGALRYMFFTSSTGGNHTKKGRQVMARKTVASLSKGHQVSNYSRTKEPNSSASLLTTQSSSTQTDMRDSEIQTDPWWYRSEGVPLLCCRGSHRKLEKAKWNARAGDGAFDHTSEDDAISVQSARLSTSTFEDSNTTDLKTARTNSSQRTVSCGPSYGSRAFFPDPLDIWVSTYQKLRLEDEIQEDKITAKRQRLIKRQEKRTNRRSQRVADSKPLSVQLPRQKTRTLNLSKIDHATLDQTLDQICRQLHL